MGEGRTWDKSVHSSSNVEKTAKNSYTVLNYKKIINFHGFKERNIIEVNQNKHEI